MASFWEYFALFSLILIAGISLSCGFFVIINNPKKKLNILSSLMNFSVATWAGSWAIQILTVDHGQAVFLTKIINSFAAILTVFSGHWMLSLVKVDKKKINKAIISLCYALAAFFTFNAFFTADFVSSTHGNIYFTHYSYPGKLYIFFIAILYFGLSGYALLNLWKSFLSTRDSVLKNQLRYILFGFPFGAMGGSTAFFLYYGIMIPPFGLPFVFIYYACLNYAIVRHRLMDIRTVIGKTGVYLLSFLMTTVWAVSLAYIDMVFFSLPLPLFAAIAAASSAVVFAQSVGLSNKIAAKYFYYSLYGLKAAMAELTKKLNRTIDLESIVISIDYALLGSLKLERAGIILKDPETNIFALKHFIGFDEKKTNDFAEKNKIFLISLFKKMKAAVLKDEIPILAEKTMKKYPAHLEETRKGMETSGINVIVPLLIEEEPIGFMILGEKVSLSGYNAEELRLLDDFSVQAAVVLNSAIALSQTKKREEELEKFYRLALGREMKMIELKNKIKEIEDNKN